MRDEYKGWRIDFGNPPIPCRDFDWTATHSLFDPEQPNHDLLIEAASYKDLVFKIDAWTADIDHTDNDAIDYFADKMKAKMAIARAKGHEGWDDPTRCSPDTLVRLMYAHAEKGDPVDVANFCMMLDWYGASTSIGTTSLKQMKAWDGGFGPPNDWDGGAVYWGNNEMQFYPELATDFSLWENVSKRPSYMSTIIAYNTVD